MRKSELRQIIREEILNEVNLDDEMNQKINEFGELSNEIDKLNSTLKKLKSRYTELESSIRPILEEISDLKQSSIQTNKYLVTIKRKGFDRENFKYKEAFETSLTKVNKQTRAILEEVLNQTKSITRVASSIGVQKLESSGLQTVLNKIKSGFNKLKSKFGFVKKEMNNLQSIAKKLV